MMPVTNLSLQALYAQHQGKVSDKWSSYLALYESVLGPLRQSVRTLLEIGVQNGGSLEIWAQYFAKAKHIVGCDIDAKCADLQFEDSRIHVVVDSAIVAATRDKVARVSPAFDVVIEDGSHVPKDVIAAFLYYWPMITPGGVFIAEDLHCDYFPGHEGGIARRNLSNRFFAELVHIINLEHWRGVQSISHLLRDFASRELIEQARLADSIASISFHNSVAVIRKAKTQSDTTLGDRVVVGSEAKVDDAVLRAGNIGVGSLLGLHETSEATPASMATSFSGLFSKR